MSWTKKNVHPGKIVSTSQEVDVAILEVDPVKRRISLGLKQTLPQPVGGLRRAAPGRLRWSRARSRTRPSSVCSSGLEGDIDGMIHLSDLDWNRPGEQVIEEYKKGDVRARPSFSMWTSRRSVSRSA